MRSGKLICLAGLFMVVMASCKDDDGGSKVTASFTVDSEDVTLGDSVVFTNTSENASYYQWDFGDGDQSYDENPEHLYTVAGTYVVSLTAIGSGGGSDTYTDTLTVGAGDYSIYEGTGIEGVTLYESTWGDLSDTYGTDTTYYTTYTQTSNGTTYYLHYFVYEEYGILFYVYGTTEKLTTSDLVFGIALISPYAGVTSAGIGVGSDMDDVVSYYGTGSSYSSGSWTGYEYDEKGIGFYEYASSGEVDEIDIWYADNSSRTAGDFVIFERPNFSKIMGE